MNIETEIQQIKDRNARVEGDKAWETSITRRATIAIITYIFAVLWLYSIKEVGIWLKAVIPTVGYLLSTISIPLIKKFWLSERN
jgi:hypothetical protein